MDTASNNSSYVEGCHLHCKMVANERGQFDVVAVLRLIMASLSIIGALSIIVSAVYRKTVCNPRVHPIFVLSIVDTLLSVLWISGGLVWLKGDGLRHHHDLRVGCFIINCLTVILQCVGMNVTLIYSLLAYSSIKQRDFSGVYMVQQQTPVSVHVWPPLCSFTTYFIAWTLPVPLIMIPFGVIAQQCKIVEKANNCSCWCLPFYGNVLPRGQIGPQRDQQEEDHYLLHLHYFIACYSAVLMINFIIVFSWMAAIYYKVFRLIKRMIITQENNENTPLYGATQAMILAGQKDAKKRVFLFFAVYFITGAMTFLFGLLNIAVVYEESNPNKIDNDDNDRKSAYYFLFFEALTVPCQGFLNALVYGWTRGDFLSVMSARRHSRPQPDSVSTSYGGVEQEEEEEETEGVDWERGLQPAENSLLFSSTHSMTGGEKRRRRGPTALAPVSPAGLLRDV